MPITINGSGTVTGISAGGLPDACITTDALAAEAARQGIRDRYAEVQVAIDAAADPDEIKAALEVTP